MKCNHCKEAIEEGDASIPVGINGRTRFFHVNCYVRQKTERAQEDLERQAQLARTVH